MNYDLLVDNLACKLEAECYHLINNPKYLPCCGQTVCDSCIIKASRGGGNVFKCALCRNTSKIRIINDECALEPNMKVQAELDRYTIDINHYLLRKLDTTIDRVQERFDSNEEYLEKRKCYIEQEIHAQVETLKAQLDDYEQAMKTKLAASCRNTSSNIKSFTAIHQADIDAIKATTNDLKVKAYSYVNNTKVNFDNKENCQTKEEVYLNSLPQQKSINKIFAHMNTLSNLNRSVSGYIEEINFYPNIEPIDQEIIGSLKTIKEIGLEDQFKSIKNQFEINSVQSLAKSNKKMPFSPRALCVLDTNNLLFTDSHTKQLTQLTLETGDYVRSTSLNGALKTPDGVCINHKKGVIYLVESDSGSIFKLDKAFNVLKKFGSNLKWPRGICYDSDAHNGHSLYVCDYLNQRVVIYNDQEQVRGELLLTSAGKLVPSYNTSKFNSVEIEDEFRFSPMNIAVSGAFVYVTDDWSGSNCIRVFDKLSGRLVRNIGDLQAWNPSGLFIDEKDNVFTLARLYYETGVPYLFCFSKSGELLYKTNLNISDNDLVNNFLIDKYTDKTSYRIVACGDSKLHFINFE